MFCKLYDYNIYDRDVVILMVIAILYDVEKFAWRGSDDNREASPSKNSRNDP